MVWVLPELCSFLNKKYPPTTTATSFPTCRMLSPATLQINYCAWRPPKMHRLCSLSEVHIENF